MTTLIACIIVAYGVAYVVCVAGLIILARTTKPGHPEAIRRLVEPWAEGEGKMIFHKRWSDARNA